MPVRRDVFTNKSFFHIYDKTIDKKKVFITDYYCDLFLKIICYYSYKVDGVPYSYYRKTSQAVRSKLNFTLFNPKNKLVDIICYTLMPNHYHFLLKQRQDNGIVKCMGRSLNSFTRHYNKMNLRKGPIFLPNFQSVGILDENQLIYVTKYIHLNPIKAKLITSLDELEKYKWSSYSEYIGSNSNCISEYKVIMNKFNYLPSAYKNYLIGNNDKT